MQFQLYKSDLSLSLLSETQALYGVFLKRTCTFSCLFFIMIAFLSRNLQKVLFSAFFRQKYGVFSVEPPVFQEKHYCSQGFGHKEVTFLSKSVLLYKFLGKMLGLTSLGIKFTPICTTVHMYL